MRSKLQFEIIAFAGCALACSTAALPAHTQTTVLFKPGSYDLAHYDLGPPVDFLVISVSGGVASFTLSGADNATFTAPNNSTPTGGGFDPYYYIPDYSISASWDTTAYPYLTFYSTADAGGVSAGAGPDGAGPYYFDTFQTIPGTAQLFTGVPEPASWALQLIGFGLAGAALRATRTSPASA